MNKRLFFMLCTNYNRDPDKQLYELWESNLKDYDETQIENAIKEIIKVDKFMPTLARIIEMIDTTKMPSWFNEKIEYERVSNEELAELEKEMSIFN